MFSLGTSEGTEVHNLISAQKKSLLENDFPRLHTANLRSKIFNSLFPGAVDALYRSNDPYETFPNVLLCFLFSGFPHWAGGVLLQREEVCD